MIENTNFNYGILKSWNSSKSLADFSPTRRLFKNYRLERVETKIGRSSLNLCEIASAVNSTYSKKRHDLHAYFAASSSSCKPLTANARKNHSYSN